MCHKAQGPEQDLHNKSVCCQSVALSKREQGRFEINSNKQDKKCKALHTTLDKVPNKKWPFCVL